VFPLTPDGNESPLVLDRAEIVGVGEPVTRYFCVEVAVPAVPRFLTQITHPGAV